MKKLFFLLFALALFSCENNMSDVKPFIQKDGSSFRQLKDGTTTTPPINTTGDTHDKPILDP